MTAISPVVDPKTGDVLAMVTNKLYGPTPDGKHSAANLFTDASANAASTYKLFSLVAASEGRCRSGLVQAADREPLPRYRMRRHHGDPERQLQHPERRQPARRHRPVEQHVLHRPRGEAVPGL